MLQLPKEEHGAGLNGLEAYVVVSKATDELCQALFEQYVPPENMSEDHFIATLWKYIFFRCVAELPPWADNDEAFAQKLVITMSADYRNYCEARSGAEERRRLAHLAELAKSLLRITEECTEEITEDDESPGASADATQQPTQPSQHIEQSPDHSGD